MIASEHIGEALSPLWLKTRMTPLLDQVGADGRFVVAVSGGGDSMALLRLAAAAFPGRVIAATVDHRLRSDSAREAEQVKAWATALGVPHRTLVWTDGAPGPALQDRARQARYALLAGLCRDAGTSGMALPLVTAHTREDQAETFAMRAARRSGMAGLACMQPAAELPGAPPVALLRPLLGANRADLRCVLRRAGQAWLDDPSNEDVRFERVRIRAAALALDASGLTAARLTRAAGAFAKIRKDMSGRAYGAVRGGMRAEGMGWIVLDRDLFAALPPLLRRPACALVVAAIGGAARAPSPDAVGRLAAMLSRGDFPGATLGGCRVERIGSGLLFGREPGRRGPAPMPAAAGTYCFWDNRFFVAVPKSCRAGTEIRPLGGACNTANGDGSPRRWTAQTLPGLWHGAVCLGPLPHRFAGFDRVRDTLARAYRAFAAEIEDS